MGVSDRNQVAVQPPTDPLGVRDSAEYVMSRASDVAINDEAVDRLCTTSNWHLKVPDWNTRYHFGDGTPRTANYLLLLDALNFSFWDEPRWRIHYRGERLDGYWALAAALKRSIEDGYDLCDAGVLARISSEQLSQIFRGEHRIPLFEERVSHAREVGRVLLAKYGGQFANLINDCGHDAPTIAARVVAELTSFRDEGVYCGRRVAFYKRAQILAADVYGAFGGAGLGALAHIDALTCFADYKLPQLLRRLGVLQYSAQLAGAVDSRREIPAGSDSEIEIRAGTIVGIERMRVSLASQGIALNSVQIDWALWAAAQGAPPDGKPYHQTRTIFY